jgi:hypothetical protein
MGLIALAIVKTHSWTVERANLLQNASMAVALFEISDVRMH